MKTFEEIRKNFWDSHPEFDEEYNPSLEQNDYCADIRCAFVEHIDHLSKNGEITEEQAYNITL